MDLKVLLTSTLIATLISSIVSALVSIYLKSQEYKFEYKKYILQKRREAYSLLETTLASLNVHYFDMNTGRPIHVFFYGTGIDNENPIQDAITKLRECKMNSMWLSEEADKIVYSFALQLTNSVKDYGQATPGYAFRFEKGIAEFETFQKQINELYKTLFHDIRHLDDIKKFRSRTLPM